MQAAIPIPESVRYYSIGYSQSLKRINKRIDDYNASSLEGWQDVAGTIKDEFIDSRGRPVTVWDVQESLATALDGRMRKRGSRTVKTVLGKSKVWRSVNGQLQHKQMIKGGTVNLAERLLRIYAAFLNEQVAYGVITDQDYPMLRTNNKQLSKGAGSSRMTSRSIINHRHALTAARILLADGYMWYGSNSSFGVKINPEMIVREAVKDVNKHRRYLFAVGSNEAVEKGHRTSEERVAGQGERKNSKKKFPHTERSSSIIKQRITSNNNNISKPIPHSIENTPHLQSSGRDAMEVQQPTPNSAPSHPVFKNDDKMCIGEAKNRAKSQAGKVVNMARKIFKDDFFRGALTGPYQHTWLAESQQQKLKEDIEKLYAGLTDKNLHQGHSAYLSRLRKLARYYDKDKCGRCGWTGREQEQCPDCQADIKPRTVPLPSTGYWNPQHSEYFTRIEKIKGGRGFAGFGITKEWYEKDKKVNRTAYQRGILRREVKRVLEGKGDPMEALRSARQRIGKLKSQPLMEEFLERVRDRNLRDL